MKPLLLYVEDDALVARPMVRFLEREGFGVVHVATCAGARHAFDRHREVGPRIDAVLTDWNLVGETAEPVVVWAREARVPAVVMSGSTRVGILPWLEKTDLDGLRDWLRSVRGVLAELGPR